MERRTVELELRKRGEVINQHDEILPIKEFTNKKCQQNVAIKIIIKYCHQPLMPNYVVQVEAVEIREEFEERGRKLEAEIR